MAVIGPTRAPAINGKYRVVLRVGFVAISMALVTGITVGVFIFIPAVNDAVKLALSEGGATFVGVVIVPAGVLAAINTVWAIRVLWKISGSGPDDENVGDRDGS